MEFSDMIMDLARESGGRNVGGMTGGTVGGMIGQIWGPIGKMVGQDIGSSAGNRLQRLFQGEDPWKQLLGGFVVDPFMKPLQRAFPAADALFGNPFTSSKKKDPNKITWGQ